MADNKIPRDQTEFLLPEGLLTFCKVFPGQAEDSQQAGTKAYKTEYGTVLPQNFADKDIRQAVWNVANFHDQKNAQLLYAERIRTLEQMDKVTKRDISKYPYYAGMHVFSLSAVHSVKSLKLGDINMSNPEDRARFDKAVQLAAPKVVRFCDPNSPADLQLMERMNQERRLQNLAPIPESEYRTKTIPLLPHELWSGCYGMILGRAYYSPQRKSVHLALEQILFTRPGPRLAMAEVSPDTVFGAFAPAAELAPPPPQQLPPQFPPPAGPNWGNMFG